MPRPLPPPPPNTTDSDEKKHLHVPKSTLIIFWVFVAYFILSIVAAAYFVTTTKVKLFNLNQIASLSTNVATQSLDLPICISRTNKSALRSSILENEYGGKVSSFAPDISSQSAE